MATSDLVHLGEAPLFVGTNYAQWKIRMSWYFRAMGQNIWRIVDVGFSPPLDHLAPTNEEEKCLHLDAQATNTLFSALSIEIFDAICNLKNVHEMWTYLQDNYEISTSTKDDCIEEQLSGEECSISNSDNEVCSTSSSYNEESSTNDCIQEWLSEDECSTSSSDNEYCSKPSTSTLCLMAKGKKKVNNDDDNNPSYDEIWIC